MSAATLTHTTELVTTTCWCGIAHAIPTSLMQWANQDSKNAVYCPLGHEWVRRETDAAKLRRQLDETRRREAATRDLLEHEQRSHAATRGHLTRAKKRVAAGVCPCCTRHFENLHRHMAAKHPDYAEAGQ